MKKLLVSLLALTMTVSLFGCSNSGTQSNETAQSAQETQAAESEQESYSEGDETTHEHTIAVLVYSRTDEEVLAFRKYLEDYIAGCFNVNFLYSDSITTSDEEMAFIQEAADNGADGIMSFNSYDLQAEVELCEENEMYYMMASGSVSDEDFAAAESNPYFLGVVGPGSEIEYQAGADMAQYFVDQAYGNEYTILSGGASMGNEMHLQRTIGILDTLQKDYGVTFDTSSEELAASAEIVHATAGDVTVCIIPGYLDFDQFLQPAIEEYEKDQFGCVLSVLPGSAMEETLLGANVGVIDSFTEANMSYFEAGELCYVAGKYSSIIGPSFAAMYNAVTGYAEQFRDNGKAFQVEQGFWTATDVEEYKKMYTLGASLEINAYNFDDLYNVCALYNPDATLADLQELAESYTYEDVVARRGL